MIRQIWHIGFNDIKIMVRDKVFFFWTLLFPLVFIIIFGNVYPGGRSHIAASLMVLNQDKGQWGEYFQEKLKAPDIILQEILEIPEDYNRILIIPEDFSERIRNKEAQSLILQKHAKASATAAAHIETKIVQAIAKTITELIIYGDDDIDDFFESPIEFQDIIEIRSKFPKDTITEIPGGFDHTIPGVIVQFIMMMVLIYGGVSIMEDRKKGVLTRILYSNVSISSLWAGKFLGRFLMGIVQAFILIFTGLLFFGLNLGNFSLFFINVILFSIAISSLSIFIGSVFGKEDLIIGISILLANVFAALGGCWWPIEIVPEHIRNIAMITPAYWAMDAFHQIIFFNRGLEDIILNYSVLILYTMIFSFFAIKYFKIRD